MVKKRNNNVIPYVIMLIVMVVVAVLLNQPSNYAEMKTSEAIDLFEQNKVESLELNIGNGNAEIKLRDGQEMLYRVPSVSYFIEKIDPYLDQYNVEYELVAPTSFPAWLSAVPYIIMIVFMGVLFFNMYGQANGGGKGLSVGRARTKDAGDLSERKYFKDVAGADEEKEELVEIVEFLKDPAKFSALGARIPKGVLLVGPPGTGKTLLAKATAGEAGVPFFSISGSDFVEMYVGVGASRVRDLFDKAKRAAPSIIFIDEIDAVGRQRGAGLGGGHDEREQTLNQLLVEMDGFGVNEGVIVIAATNRADILDPALMRPGRFDRQVYVYPPDMKGREEILKVHSRGKPLDDDVDFRKIAGGTIGFTGADLENLMNEAALLAARRCKTKIGMAEISEATIKVMMGPAKKSKVPTEKVRRLTAYHEGGHALIHYYLESLDDVHEVTITPRGPAGGYTLALPKEEKGYGSKMEMKDEIVSLLGGRVAEKLVLNDISTGASSDIQRATKIARDMVTRYGMSDNLGPIVYGQAHDDPFLGRDLGMSRNYSESTAAQIDQEVKEIIESAYERCTQILSDHMDRLEAVAQALLERETLNAEEFVMVMEGKTLPPMSTEPEKKAPHEPSFYQTLPEDAQEIAKPIQDDAAPKAPETPETLETPDMPVAPEEPKTPETPNESDDEDETLK